MEKGKEETVEEGRGNDLRRKRNEPKREKGKPLQKIWKQLKKRRRMENCQRRGGNG